MAKDPNEIPEIVGSRDLREVFDKGRSVRGGLFINNAEIQPISATNITGLLAALNAAADRTFVDASIDDGYHLVLEARSPAPISIRAGAPYVETAAQPIDPGAKAVADAIGAARRERGDDQRNTILEDLGLPGAESRPADAPGSVAHPPAGMSASDRHKARHERAVASGAIRGFTPRTDVQGNAPERRKPDIRTQDEKFNPVPGDRRLGSA